MNAAEISALYRDYLTCLNMRNLARLGEFVDDDVVYRAMLEGDFRDIPDLHFEIDLLICDPPYLASRLKFDCRPTGIFLGLHINGSRIAFAENVFYAYSGRKISRVWSVVDKAAIEAQLSRS